jgi:Tol biopolymer transport system component/predicted Ser/Thr protein kinase
MLGRTISHYRIEDKLGEGGMGLVYRAFDLSLNRSVAIKFLSSEIADAEHRRRFQQEAQTASSLNHPHILTVFEAGAIDDQQYLVTEFIDGYTLREWARREQPSVRQMVDLAITIADALAIAHRAGILHRDIKPENILVAKSGYAKLVDFGLAKLLENLDPGQLATRTISAGPTRPGVILGTVAYMSPEQAAGKPVDVRSDIFAFGIVLYELLAGQRPFVGESDLLVLQAILHSLPRPLAEIRPDAPYELRLVVEKAIEKDPGDRYQSMRELVVDLKRVQRLKTSEAPVPPVARPAKRGRAWLPALTGALAALALAAAVWSWRRPEPWENPLANAQFTRFTDFEGAELDAAISADGKFVGFLADRDGPMDAWVSQVGTGEFLNLTKGRFLELLHEEVRSIGFSADGAQVWLRVFGTGSSGRASIWLVPTMGGAPRPFLDNGITAAWSPDGTTIAYHEGGPGDPIFLADRNGSNRRQLFTENPGRHCHHLTWSPDGRFLYFVRGIPDIFQMDIWRIPVAGGDPERITNHNSIVNYPALVDRRTLLYTATAEDGSGPWLYSIDVERHVPHRVSLGLEKYMSLSASADGRRVIATVANPVANLWTVPVAGGVADEPAASRVSLPVVRASTPMYGPDFILYLSSQGGADGLWKFKDGVATELWMGSDGAVASAPAVSPDGRQICFSIRKQGRVQLYLMSAEGINKRPLAPALDVRGTAAWSPDGKTIVVAADEGKGPHLFQLPVDGGAPARMLEEPSTNPVWSPDGRLIVYSGPAIGGRSPVKAITADKKPFPLPDFRVLRTAGHRYRFLPDGKSLLLLQGEFRQQNFWQLDLATGKARKLTNLRGSYSLRSFDVSPDGRKILFDRVRENSDVVLIER